MVQQPFVQRAKCRGLYASEILRCACCCRVAVPSGHTYHGIGHGGCGPGNSVLHAVPRSYVWQMLVEHWPLLFMLLMPCHGKSSQQRFCCTPPQAQSFHPLTDMAAVRGIVAQLGDELAKRMQQAGAQPGSREASSLVCWPGTTHLALQTGCDDQPLRLWWRLCIA